MPAAANDAMTVQAFDGILKEHPLVPVHPQVPLHPLKVPLVADAVHVFAVE